MTTFAVQTRRAFEDRLVPRSLWKDLETAEELPSDLDINHPGYHYEDTITPPFIWF